MNLETDPIRLRLMKHVERAVRPVFASVSRKVRMRKELLGHLMEVYDQELQQLGDPSKALAHSIERFGAPDQITPRLQQTVGLGERWESKTGRWLVPPHCKARPDESVMRFAVRGAVLFGAYTLIVVAITAGLSTLIKEENPPPWPAVGVAWVGSTIVGMLLFLLLTQHLARAIRAVLDGPARRTAVLRAAALAALAGPMGVLALASMMMVPIHTDTTPLLDKLSTAWPVLLIGPLIALGVAAAWEEARRKPSEWTTLVLD